MKIQTLVATMKQDDFSLLEKMNIQTASVISNQTYVDRVDLTENEYGVHKMISTKTRGVGLNRNFALLASDADILLFADDDIRYYDGLKDGVCKAFEDFPDADVIIFSVDIEKNGKITEKRWLKNKRLNVTNSLKFGTYVIAVKNLSVKKKNITFNLFFGGGCIYGSGEDTLFLKECFDKKLKVYSNEYILGVRCKDESSWFSGYNEKFFFDKGALYGTAFPRLKYAVAFYFAIKFSKNTDFGILKCYNLMRKGIEASTSLTPFSEIKV